jgi:DNA-binding GntR family transcriptional regulator
MQFHHELAAATGCDVLVRHIHNSQVLHLNWRYTLAKPAPLPEGWHTELVEVLCSGSEQAADRAMRKHVVYRMEEVIDTYEKFLASGEVVGGGFRGPQRRRINFSG